MTNEFPDESAVRYSGWAWVGGLFAVVWGAWLHGQPVVGYGGEFAPEAVCRILEEYGVTHTLLTPTMVRMMQAGGFRRRLLAYRSRSNSYLP